MKTYFGDRTLDGIVVTVDGDDLPDHVDAHRYATGGFEWGYEGDAPKQLAFALAFDHCGDVDRAKRIADPFMRRYVANFGNDWRIVSDEMEAMIAALDQPAA